MAAAPDEFAGFAPAPATAAAPPADEFAGFAPAPVNSADAPPETAARVVGLGDRALIQGIGHLADTPGALMSLADRAGLSLHNYTRRLFGLKDDTDAPPPIEAPHFGSDVTSAASDVLGLPRPATSGERVASAAAEALPSAVLAPEAPVMGALSAAAGGAASQSVAESGGSPTQQTLAGLAVGSVPALASAGAQGARALVRNQADTAARVADAAASGTPLSAGQATGSRFLQAVEGASSKFWGGGPIKATAENQTEHLGNSVDAIVNNLAPGADVSPTGAGNAINAGAAAAKTNMRAAEKAAYDKVDTLVHPQTPIDVSGTMAKLNALAAPTPGAAATTGDLVSSKIAAMRENLQADLQASQAPGGAAQRSIFAAGGTPPALPAGSLPYSAARQLRTAVGNSIDWGFAPSDPVTNGGLKQVYAALSEDLKAGASKVSPDAAAAANDAASLYATNQTRREFLNSVIDKAGGPEAVYAAATNGTKQGATKIGGVMSALDPGQQNLVRATVIDRLGKAIPSQQNATGDALNVSTFLTNWNKLAPEAKDALFGASSSAKSVRPALDSLANTMSTIRNSKIFPNPSGTGESIGHGAGLFALLEGGGAALMGHPGHLAAVGGAIGANNLLARALTNKRTVTWLASSAKLPTSALPNAIDQLAKMGKVDPDARDLAASLQGQQERAP